MSITELLQRITNSQLARDCNRRTSYHDMVRQVAEGHEPPSEEVDQLLRETDKTVEQFAADVEQMTRRLKWRSEYDVRPNHQAEMDDLKAKIAKCNRVLEAAEKKHDEDTGPLYGRIAWLKDRVREADYAERGLSDTCMNDDLLAEIDEIAGRIKAAYNRRNELEERVRSLRRAAESDLYEIRHVIYETQAKQLKQRAKEQQAKADSLEPEIADAVATIAELEGREKELRQRMLEP